MRGELAGEELGPDGGVGLHDGPLLVIQRPGLEEDPVGDADFSKVVHGAGAEDQVRHVVGGMCAPRLA